MGHARRASRRLAVSVALAAAALLTVGAGEAFAGQIKVCKQISAGSTDSLRTKEFSFTVTTDHPSHPGPYTISGVRSGECRLLTNGWYPRDIPHLKPNGMPTRATVTEVMTGGYVVQNVTVSGSRGMVSRSCTTDAWGRQTCDPTISFTMGPYTNAVTYTNRAAPLAQPK